MKEKPRTRRRKQKTKKPTLYIKTIRKYPRLLTPPKEYIRGDKVIEYYYNTKSEVGNDR